MPQQLLNASKIRAIVQKVRRETVPDRVGTDVRIKTDLFEILRNLPTNRSTAQPTTMLIDKESLLGADGHARRCQLTVVKCNVVSKCSKRMGPEWNESLTPTFTSDEDGFAGIIKIVAIDPHDLTDTNTS